MSEKQDKKKPAKKRNTKLSFQNDFYSDLNYANMLYAVIVRSPTEKGMITSVTHPDLPDGYFLFTARDVPGKNIIDTPMGKVPIFSEGNINYMGEPLGILVGPDEEKLNELLNEIEIVFDSTPIESYLEDVLADESTSLSENDALDLFSLILATRNVEYGKCFEKNKRGKCAGIQGEFEKCAFVTEKSWTYVLNPADYREPTGAICSYDSETLEVITPTQWLSNLRFTLSEALNLKSDNILVKKTKTFSTGTNGIWYNSIIASQVAVAAYKTGKKVKLSYSRSEQTKFMEKLLPITIIHKTGIDENGKLLAMQVHIDVDAGAYNPFAQEIIDRLVIASIGCYDCPSISINANAYRSSNPPSSINIELIDSAALYAIENQINELCTISGFTPDELRIKNLNHSKIAKNNSPFNLKLKQIDTPINALVHQSDFSRKYSSYKLDAMLRRKNMESQDDNDFYISPLRGIGLACGFEGAGFYGSEVYGNDQYLETIFTEEGNLIIHTIPVSSSIQEIWTKTAEDILDLNSSQIKINSTFSPDEELPLPENVYNNISVMTELLNKCCEAIKKRPANAKLPYTVTRKISSVKKKEWNVKEFHGSPFHSASFACATVELELDPYTFREHLRGINVVISCGKVLSPSAAEKNLRLSIQKVLGNLVKHDAIECDNIKISFMDSKENPCQIGELIYNIIPSAYIQALNQALSSTIPEIPIESNTIYDTIQDRNNFIRIEKMKQIMLEAELKLKEQTEQDALIRAEIEKINKGGLNENSNDAE